MQDETVNLWGLFVSSFISSTVAPGGSEALLAYLVAEKSFNVMHLVSIATIGNTLGALTTWLLGRFAETKYSLESLLESKYKKSLGYVQKWGVWSLFFSWLPIIGDGLCFVAGWLKLPFLVSLLVIFIGKAIRYIFVAYLFS